MFIINGLQTYLFILSGGFKFTICLKKIEIVSKLWAERFFQANQTVVYDMKTDL